MPKRYVIRIFLFSCLTLLSLQGFSQDSSLAFSRFQNFTLQSGKLLKTEFLEVGTSGTLNFLRLFVVQTRDMLSGDSVKAVCFCSSWRKPGIADPSAIYIDAHELDSVILALEAFSRELVPRRKKTNSTVVFITSNDVRFSLEESWRVDIGRLYHHLRTEAPGFGFSIRDKYDLDSLIAMLHQAATLSSKK